MKLTPYRRIRFVLTACRHTTFPNDLLQYGTDKTFEDRYRTLEMEWRSRSGRRSPSLAWALNDIASGFWAGGLFKVAGDAAQMMSPLLVKALIRFSQEGP